MRNFYYLSLLVAYAFFGILAALEEMYILAGGFAVGYLILGAFYIFGEKEKKKTTIKAGDIFTSTCSTQTYAIVKVGLKENSIDFLCFDSESGSSGTVYRNYFSIKEFLDERDFSYLGNIND